MNIRLSIVICTFNRADLLVDALNSIVAQSGNWDKVELIVIDNNSNDNTREVVKQFEKESRFLKYFPAKSIQSKDNFERNTKKKVRS